MSVTMLPAVPIPGGVSMLGEVISWQFPAKVSTSLTAIRAALSAANLDVGEARTLCARHAFVRAVRRLANQRLARILHEDADVIEFQFTAEHNAGRQLVYTNDGKVSLDKASEAITASDPQTETLARSELSACREERRGSDLTRLLHRLFDQKADLYRVPGASGAYFVPQAHVQFVPQIDVLVTALGGSVYRLPVPDGMTLPVPQPQANATVQTIIVDGIMDAVNGYEQAISVLNSKTRDKSFDSAYEELCHAERKIDQYAALIGAHKAILEDHVAGARSKLREREEWVKACRDAEKRGLPLPVEPWNETASVFTANTEPEDFSPENV